MTKEKKIKTITKMWQVDAPVDENVDNFIKRIQESCSNIKKDFPDFLSYKFFIDIDAHDEYSGFEFDLTMQCTRYETDAELQTRGRQSKAGLLRARKAKVMKEKIEREQLANLKAKYE